MKLRLLLNAISFVLIAGLLLDSLARTGTAVTQNNQITNWKKQKIDTTQSLGAVKEIATSEVDLNLRTIRTVSGIFESHSQITAVLLLVQVVLILIRRKHQYKQN